MNFWFLEHYVSPEVAAVYDAVTILIDPAKIAEKLGIKGQNSELRSSAAIRC